MKDRTSTTTTGEPVKANNWAVCFDENRQRYYAGLTFSSWGNQIWTRDSESMVCGNLQAAREMADKLNVLRHMGRIYLVIQMEACPLCGQLKETYDSCPHGCVA